ncbi:pirin family protein [Acinetobacter sp. CFCC 10889]|uniref:pirin family protein n=1 Tax=Acinetobacter sp. CFCC 10889 TaxID=1775557 RepID=UPI000DD0910E|nr:pirin family protein [Acinetobacter sp. CFCC 10889]
MKTLAFIHRNDTIFSVGDFHPVKTIFSHHELGNTVSPFLLLDHLGPGILKPTNLSKGVSEHPHRGFETVTMMFKGELEHRDSSGGGGIIAEGDVQWMTAASGVIHKEVFSEAFSKQGGAFEIVQLWVNLPAKDKLNPARYQSLKKENIPVIHLENDAGMVRVIAGEYTDQQGIAKTHTPIMVLDIALKAGQTAIFPANRGDSTLIYLHTGKLKFNPETEMLDDEVLEDQALAVMSSHGENVQVTALKDSKFLLLSAAPLNEPINAKGFFVMNTYSEILQAYEDLKAGKFIQTVQAE